VTSALLPRPRSDGSAGYANATAIACWPLVRLRRSTQRGNTGTALAGSIASAIRFLAKDVLTGGECVSGEISRHSVEIAQGFIMRSPERAIGRDLIEEFCKAMKLKGVTENIIKQQFANLKASGDYARIALTYSSSAFGFSSTARCNAVTRSIK
jgi:hypothetical protein